MAKILRLVLPVIYIAMLSLTLFFSFSVKHDLSNLDIISRQQTSLQNLSRSLLLCGLMGNDIQFAHTTEEIQGVLDTYGSEYTALDKSFEQLNVLTKNPSELEHLERAHTLAIKTDKVARKLFDVLMRDDASPMGKFQIAIAGMHKIEKLTAQIMDDVALLSASFETQAREKKSELELNINAIEGLAFGSLIALSLFGIKSMMTGRPPSSKNS